MTSLHNPSRGEIWDIEFDPTKGAEINKTRPAVVMSVSSVGKLPLRIVVPITDWDNRFSDFPWFVRLSTSKANGLSKESGADAFQVKSVSVNRFRKRRGQVLDAQLDDIASAIAICIGL